MRADNRHCGARMRCAVGVGEVTLTPRCSFTACLADIVRGVLLQAGCLSLVCNLLPTLRRRAGPRNSVEALYEVL